MMAKVESPVMLMLSIGSICTATRSVISVFHDEGVGDMSRPLVGGDRDDVKAADSERRPGVARHPAAGRRGDAARLIIGHRLDGAVGINPDLHLDRSEERRV